MILRLFVSLVSVGLLTACSNAGFGGANGKTVSKKTKTEDVTLGGEDGNEDGQSTLGQPEDTGERVDGKRVLRIREEFDSKIAVAPIDMVWAIDNSGSMGDKIRQVEKNFAQFVQAVGGKTDLKLAVMTQFCDGERGPTFNPDLCLNAPDATVKMSRINVMVGSYNVLAMLAAAHAPASEVQVDNSGSYKDGKSVTIKGQRFEPTKVGTEDGFVEFPILIAQAAGTLSSFFRADSRRVVVVVSDEEDIALGASQYTKALEAIDPAASKHRFYGFVNRTGADVVSVLGSGPTVGVPTGDGVCRGIRSEVFPALAKKTGGAVYDVCASDWTSTFSQLTKDVLSVATNQFGLSKSKVRKVVEVLLNETPLDASQYRLDGTTVVIDEEALGDKSGTLTIRYEYVEA